MFANSMSTPLLREMQIGKSGLTHNGPFNYANIAVQLIDEWSGGCFLSRWYLIRMIDETTTAKFVWNTWLMCDVYTTIYGGKFKLFFNVRIWGNLNFYLDWNGFECVWESSLGSVAAEMGVDDSLFNEMIRYSTFVLQMFYMLFLCLVITGIHLITLQCLIC